MNNRYPQIVQAMLARAPQQIAASDGFVPGGIVEQMLARQRAAEAAKAPPPKVPPPKPIVGVDQQSVLQRRLREAGVE